MQRLWKLLDALKNIEDKWAEEIESINQVELNFKKSNTEYVYTTQEAE